MSQKDNPAYFHQRNRMRNPTVITMTDNLLDKIENGVQDVS